MGRRAVALNASFIHINEISAYNNGNNINLNNNIAIDGNTNITNNLKILGTDDINHNYNIVDNTIVYKINTSTNVVRNENGIEYSEFNLYIGNTYIFDQTEQSDTTNQLIIISKKLIEYNRTQTSGDRRIRVPYNNGVEYNTPSTNNENWSYTDSNTRTKIRFTPTESGIFYIVSLNHNASIKYVTINILNNVYKYGSFVTNGGLALNKNLNVGGNMNVNNGRFFVLSNTNTKAVGINTTIPRIGLDMTNLPNFNDAILLPNTSGVGTTTGVDGMFRYESSINALQIYYNDKYSKLGITGDRDNDTNILAEISGRLNQLDFISNGHTRLTLSDKNTTLIGIATTLPNATLEINGNLNIINDNTISGINFCNDLTNNDNYLNVNLTNTDNKSFDFISNNGGLSKSINNNLIETINNKTTFLNNSELNATNKISTISGITSETYKNNRTLNISGNLIKTIQNTSIEIYSNNNINTINNSIETYSSTHNSTINNNLVYNINNTKLLNVHNTVNKTFKEDLDIINNSNSTNIYGTFNHTSNNINSEIYANINCTNLTNSTSIIKNNYNKIINSNYNINVDSNTLETYNSNFTQKTALIYDLNVHGKYNIKNNDSAISYNNNLDLTSKASIDSKIHSNNSLHINNDYNETTYKSINNTVNSNVVNTIKYNYNLNNSNTTTNNITENLNMTINNDYNATIAEIQKNFTGTTTNNIFYNDNINKNFTHNVNKSSNSLVLDTKNKYVNFNSTEFYNHNKLNYLYLFGHELSTPDLNRYNSEPIYANNYVNIVLATSYNTNIQNDPNYYVFPGNTSSEIVRDNWYVFLPSSSVNQYPFRNLYNIITLNSSGYNLNNIGTEYYILGPNNNNCYAIVLKNMYNPSLTYTYDQKFIIGPRFHQLEYNITRNYVKIFNLGNTSNSIKILKLNSSTNIVVSEYDNATITDSYLNGDNEYRRFTFIYIENSHEVINNVTVKANYYIYSHAEGTKPTELVGYLYRKTNNTLDIAARNDATPVPHSNTGSQYVWTIESSNKTDETYRRDLYYIYNTDINGTKYYIKASIGTNNIDIETDPLDLTSFEYKFTLYYYNIYHNNMFFTNVTSSHLTYNNETRAHYLTKDYKHIFIHSNPSKFIMSTFTNNNNNIGTTISNKGLFLLILNTINNIETFKIYEVNTDTYLFNDKSLNWIIESIAESNNAHDEAVYTIKPYNNGYPTKFLYNNNNVLDSKRIKLPIETNDYVKFTIVNTTTGIIPGTYSKKIYNNYIKNINQTEDIMIIGNTNENYESNYDITINQNLTNNITNAYNLNISQSTNLTITGNNIVNTSNNLVETLNNNNYLVTLDTTNTYKDNITTLNEGNITNIYSTYTNHIKNTNNVFISNNTTKKYDKDVTLKSSNNEIYINNDLTETIGGACNLYIDSTATIINNSNKLTTISNNFSSNIHLTKNVNITKDSNIVVNSNMNTTITNHKNILINNNKAHTIAKSNIIHIDNTKTENYYNNRTTRIDEDLDININGTSFKQITGLTNETYKNNKTIIQNTLTETISGSNINTDVKMEIVLNNASDYNLSCKKNINLNSDGIVHIINDNSNDGYPNPSNQKSLVVNGGTYIKKDLFVDGDALISKNLNVFGTDVSSFQTEDVEISDPLILIGLSQNDDNTYSGILGRTYVNSAPKFTGLVRNNNSDYALVYNINVDSTNAEEYSNTDLNNAYNTLSIDKHANFTANKITSYEPNINSYGDMYITKNIFVGLSETNNSFTFNVDSNINKTNTDFSITTNKDILYNITSGSINIISNHNYTSNIKTNRNISIFNNKTETVTGSYTNFIDSITTLTYKNTYNTNVDINNEKIINSNYDKSIYSHHYINHNNSLSKTIRNNYNLNITLNNDVNISGNSSVTANNNNIILNKNSNSTTTFNKTANIRNDYKCNINGTNTLSISGITTANYKNTDISIENNLTQNVSQNKNKHIVNDSTLKIIGITSETYKNNRAINISNNYNVNITGNVNSTINNNLTKTIHNSVETYKKNNTITISQDLNKTISGMYNINITDNSTNIIKNNISYNVNNTNTTIYNKNYNLFVNDDNKETYYGYNSNISDNFIKVINSHSNETMKQYITDYSTIMNNCNFVGNSNFNSVNGNLSKIIQLTNIKYIKDKSQETYNNKNIHINNDNDISINKNKKCIINGISSNSFNSNYNSTIIGNVDETYKNINTTINNNSNITIKSNVNIKNNSDKNLNIYGNATNYIQLTNNINVTGINNETYTKYNKTITGYKIDNIQAFLKNVSNNNTETYNNDYTQTTNGDSNNTYKNGYYTSQITTDSSVTNNTTYNKNFTLNINNSIKNADINSNTVIESNLNKTIIGDTNITYNNNYTVSNNDNISKIINSNFSHNVSNTLNLTFSSNKSITISKNNTCIISGNLNSTVTDILFETYNSSKNSTTGTSNTNNFKYNNIGYVKTNIIGLFNNNIKGSIVETYENDYNKHINGNNTEIINGYSNNIKGITSETYKNDSTIICGNLNNTINIERNKHIDSNTSKTIKNTSTVKVSGNNTKYISGTYNLTSNHSSKPNINISTLGNLNITADANINKNNNINFMTRVGIKSTVSYNPQIITSNMIHSDNSNNISQYSNRNNAYIINPKTINIIKIDTHSSLTALNNNNIFIRLELQDGAYNGQIIKILVHPIFETTFNVNNRLASGLKTNILIRVNSFCDANTNEYEIVDLILNKGGMGLSLIYVENDDSTTEAYWMLMNNNFIYQ